MNLHIQEQLATMHRQDLQRQAEQDRLARLSQNHRSAIRYTVGRAGTLMVAFGTRLQRLDQRVERVVYVD